MKVIIATQAYNAENYLVETINRNSLRYFMKGSYLVYKFFAIFIVGTVYSLLLKKATVYSFLPPVHEADF